MSESSKKLLNLIKDTSKSTQGLNSKIVSLKVKSLNPLEFLYNEKLILDNQFYILDKNFATTHIPDGQGDYYDLQVGDIVKAMMTNNGQTFYVFANKVIGSSGGSTATDYETLDNKPKINGVTLIGNKTLTDLGISVPTKTSDLINDNNFITKDANNLTYYTLATNTGSTIDLSVNSSTYVVTLALKNSAGTTISTDTIDLPLESVVVNGTYDDTTKKIILTLQNGNTIEFSVADLVSGLQTEITSNNKLSSDLVDDANHTNKFVTAAEKTNWNAKQNRIVYSLTDNLILESGSRIPYGLNDGFYHYTNGYTVEIDGNIVFWDETFFLYKDNTLIGMESQYSDKLVIAQYDISSRDWTFETHSYLFHGDIVTSLSATSTNNFVPGAKLVYDQLALKQGNLTAGSNINITNDTISATDTTYDNATTSVAGLMSAADKTKLDNTFKELTSPVRIWDLDVGVYKLPSDCVIYYNGSTDTSRSFTIQAHESYMYIGTNSNYTRKCYFCLYDLYSEVRLLYGDTSATSGGYNSKGMSGFLSDISSYVKNTLTYSTSSTTYALSAYQGYVLNQNKADKTEIPTTTSQLTNDSGFLTSHQDISGKEDTSNKVTSVSSSSTNTEYPSAKLLYDQLALTRKISDGEVVHEITENGTKIYELSDGIYYCNNKAVKYKSNVNYTLTGFIIVTTDGTEKFATVMEYDTITSFTMATDGSSSTSSKYLDVSRVRNDLNYSVSSNNYVLSAYQGYVLNQNKEDNSNKVTSISSSSTDTQYPSAKCVYDLVGDVESVLQTLNSGNGVA